MPKKLRLVVLGAMTHFPYAGPAWMHMQIAKGLEMLGHDVYYFEMTREWPYDPVRVRHVDDSNYALPYLKRVVEAFGLGDKWAYQRSYSDRAWCGMAQSKALELLAHADAVFNISGYTMIAESDAKFGRLVYYGTDPVYDEIAYQKGDQRICAKIDLHDDVLTYGENIGTADCPLTPLPRLRGRTRQPVLLDRWESGPPARAAYTTVGNWRNDGKDIEFQGETYHWSKHHEYLKFIEVPRRAGAPIELAMGLAQLQPDDRNLLEGHGWKLSEAHGFTLDLGAYADYVRQSRGEFTVAKDQNVRLRSGWFSERSACYLAAGRPVITQDTGFGRHVPTGQGLFAFNTMEDIVEAFAAIEGDYQRHSNAARALARDYFAAEKVMHGVLELLDLA